MTYRQPHTGRPALRPGMVPPALLKRSHADLVRAVLDASARIPGVFLFKTGGGAFKVNGRFVRMGTVGTADLVGWKSRGCSCDQYENPCDCLQCCDGQPKRPIFVAVEAKVGRDKLSPAQAVFLQRVRDAGGLGLEIRSVEEFTNALR